MTRLNLILCAVILLLLFWLIGCNSCRNAEIAKLKNQPAKEVVKETVRTDTVWQNSQDTFTRTKTVLKPYAVYKTDTLIEYLDRNLPASAETALYSDSVQVQYGKVFIRDTLQNNRIAGRSVRTAFTVPVVTNTVTRNIEQPKRVKGFLTGTIQGSYTNPVQAVGAGFMLQFKSDNAVEVGALFGRSWIPQWKGQQWQASYKHKISLK